MNKCEYCRELAYINEELNSIEKKLEELTIQLGSEKDPRRRARCANIQNLLLRERKLAKEDRAALEAEGYSE